MGDAAWPSSPALARNLSLRETLTSWTPGSGLPPRLPEPQIAWAAQYVTRRSEVRERQEALLPEQCAILVALAEDYRNRVWEERNEMAAEVVAGWDIGAYRLARARLRILCCQADLLGAVDALDQAGTGLGKAWRLSPQDASSVQAAWETHRPALRLRRCQLRPAALRLSGPRHPAAGSAMGGRPGANMRRSGISARGR